MSKRFSLRSLYMVPGLFLVLSVPSALADATSEKVVAAIKAAKILPAATKLNAAYAASDKELSITTFVNPKSKNSENDCKIDALLIARKALDTLKTALRVKVRFYDQSVTSYWEVKVSKADIAAFSGGAVSSDELLGSLEASKHLVESAGGAPGGVPGGASRGASSAIVVAPADSKELDRMGLRFYFPASWAMEPMENQYHDIAELTVHRKSWCSIMPRLNEMETPKAMFEHENDAYFSKTNRAILAKNNVKLGQNDKLAGLLVDVQDNSDPTQKDRLEKHLYFGSPGHIFSVSIRYCKGDSDTVVSDLGTIFSTIQLH